MRIFEVDQKQIEDISNSLECADFKEGCLLDNYIYSGLKYTAFIFEEYVNTWTSKNVLYLVPNAHKHVIQDYYNRFNNLCEV